MKIHSNLLFSGCSVTWGGELEGINTDVEYRETHRFSHLISNQLGMSYDNISRPGISNDCIAERTIEWCNNNTCDIVIIQLTQMSRTLRYNENHEYQPVCPHTIYKNSEARLATSLYYKTFYNDFLGYQNYYKNIFLLKNYFLHKNIKYIFTSINNINNVTFPNGWKELCGDVKVLNFIDFLGENNFFNNFYNKNYCINYSITHKNKLLNGTHPSELGHQKIAEEIIKLL
jgi:hypothetical protein